MLRLPGYHVKVRTLLSSSNSMTFHDFFHDLFKLSKTLGLAVIFKNTKPLLVFEHFLTLNSSTDKHWHSPKCMPFTLLNYSPLSYNVLALSTIVNNLSNKTLIFNDFQGLTIKFHDFPGQEMKFINSMTFQVFHDLNKPCSWIIA